jgi:hypothetical protein
MLTCLTPGECNDALAGDLLEEFRAGRSSAWYWRQVLDAIAIRCVQQILGHRAILLFAATWSMLAPAWLLAVANLEGHAHLGAYFSQMTWPQSNVCDLGLLLTTNLVFVWTGILVYLFASLSVRGNLRVRALGRGLLASLPVLFVAWAALIVLPEYFLAHRAAEQPFVSPASLYSIKSLPPIQAVRTRLQAQQPAPYFQNVDAQTMSGQSSPRNAMIDMRTPAIAARLPFFLIVLCTLWGAVPSTASRH